MSTISSFGPALKAARLRLGLTQEALASQAGLYRSDVTMLEGNRRPCGRDVAERLAAALRITGGNREKFIAVAICSTTAGKVTVIQAVLERYLSGEIFSIEHEVPISSRERADIVVTMKDGRRCAFDLKCVGEWKQGKFVRVSKSIVNKPTKPRQRQEE